MMNNCDEDTILTILAIVLLIVFYDVFDNKFPQLESLFNDDFNVFIMSIAIILVIIINTPVGIMLTLLITYLHFYYKDKKRKVNKMKRDFVKEHFSDSNINENFENAKDDTQNDTHHRSNDSMNKEELDKLVKESKELIENNGGKNVNDKTNEMSKKVKGIVAKSDKNFNLYGNEGCDMLTQTGLPDKHGYDIKGCRYDMKKSEQNLTYNGPPVSLCSTYKNKTNETLSPSVYPLNA